MAIGLLFVAVAFRALLMPAQNDTFWHLRAGADIWRTGRPPLTDSYSFTAAGLRWPDHEWLWQAFVYGCHRLGGLPLVSLAGAIFIVAATWIVYRLMVGPPITRFVLMTATLVPASCVWALRPQIVTLLALAGLVSLLGRERYRPIPFLFLAWANLHAGVLLGGVVLSAALAAAALRWHRRRAPENRRRLVTLAIVSPLAGLATCATPLGFGIFRFVWGLTARLQVNWIEEWQPTLPNGWLGLTFWLVTVAFVVVGFNRRRALVDGPADGWLDWVLVAATCALFPLAVRSLRNIAPFLLLAGPAASHLLGAQFRFRFPGRRAPPPLAVDHPVLNLVLLASAGAAAFAIVAFAWIAAPKRLGWRPVGDGALAAMRSCHGPLYNRYDDGGFLIWFAPDRKVFIDSRHDPYPLPFLLEAVAVENLRAPYQPLFDRWAIRCAFLPADAPLAGVLGRGGWVSRFHDGDWAVLSAPGGR
jgi:hypothetical protein